ncbi:Histidine utilization repressor [Klebsiella pneumoniae]|uniref:Histidine utilization repressor n=1 Tax=Klebsiella pneumoniae TaxID=573 RepID=A0A4P0XZN5_KLEPN|nr:Histidine utilization repressor [Klebsiella pneumoniae]
MFAQQPRSAPAPFYEKVKQAISEKIHSGVWRPHDRIPSEAELVAQFGFSRMTINRALRELTDEGLLVRLQGVGTFVAEPKGQSALFEVRSIAAEIVARHHQHRCEVLLLEETRADHIQATALSVPEGTRIFHSLMVALRKRGAGANRRSLRQCRSGTGLSASGLQPPPRPMITCR